MAITIDTDAIAEAVAALVLEELRGPVWMTVEEAAEHLRTSPATLYRRVADRVIPSHRTELGKLLFNRRELDDWVRSQ